jgi:hypothetical protein
MQRKVLTALIVVNVVLAMLRSIKFEVQHGLFAE